jgi:hypothetical protein
MEMGFPPEQMLAACPKHSHRTMSSGCQKQMNILTSRKKTRGVHSCSIGARNTLVIRGDVETLSQLKPVLQLVKIVEAIVLS